ncbi:unnamed protein product [Prorocentrum cordatum]|uniref:Uncharacterized protein n=1 Tax=Prorocentrum cordatum TaxID=2364126 RepID=A0ABN9X9U4_9DINO|nr:unnamed protein product [Polarella glacialis]
MDQGRRCSGAPACRLKASLIQWICAGSRSLSCFPTVWKTSLSDHAMVYADPTDVVHHKRADVLTSWAFRALPPDARADLSCRGCEWAPAKACLQCGAHLQADGQRTRASSRQPSHPPCASGRGGRSAAWEPRVRFVDGGNEEQPSQQQAPDKEPEVPAQPDPVALAQAQVTFLKKWVGVNGREYTDALEILENVKMEALKGKNFDQQTQSLNGHIISLKAKLTDLEEDLQTTADQIAELASHYQSRVKEIKDAREGLHMLEAQRAMAAIAATQKASASSDISELVYAALKAKIPAGGSMPAALQQQVQTLAATFNEMQHQHEAALAQQTAQLVATTAASSAAAGAQPKASSSQAPPMFAAPPATLQMPPAGAAEQPVDVDQDEEDDAMDSVGFGCGDKRTSSQPQEIANLMDANGDAEFTTIKLITFNGSCWNTFEQFLESNWSNDVTVICAQERRLTDGDVINQKIQWCQRRGWLAHIPAASFNASHEKANGVAILVRDHLGFWVEHMVSSPRKPKSQSIVDYFLISNPLAKKIDEVQTWAKCPLAPHRPVCLDFRGNDNFTIPVLASEAAEATVYSARGPAAVLERMDWSQVTFQIAGLRDPPEELHAVHDLKARLQTVTPWCELLLADIAAGVLSEGTTDQAIGQFLQGNSGVAHRWGYLYGKHVCALCRASAKDLHQYNRGISERCPGFCAGLASLA